MSASGSDTDDFSRPAWWVGYWQQLRFAEAARDELGVLLGISPIRGNAPQRIAVHVRRGDYVELGLALSPTWYRTAVQLALAMTGPGVEVTVVSDDPGWCRDSLKLDVPFSVASRTTPLEDFRRIAHADVMVASASTFSWWAGFLGSGVVLYPQGTLNEIVLPKGWVAIPWPQPSSSGGRANMNVSASTSIRAIVHRTRLASRTLGSRMVGRLDASPMERYFRDGHNDLITKNLSLDRDSVVLDFGGYVGDWTAEIRERYGSTVHVFEPVPAFAAEIRHRFESDDRVVVHQVAVGARRDKLSLNMSADATGIGVTGKSVVVDVVGPEYLVEQGIERCDLAAMNIEGGEYELLPALAEAGLLPRVERLLVQFHAVTSESPVQREECHALLASSHSCDWDYPFVWESWSRSA